MGNRRGRNPRHQNRRSGSDVAMTTKTRAHSHAYPSVIFTGALLVPHTHVVHWVLEKSS